MFKYITVRILIVCALWIIVIISLIQPENTYTTMCNVDRIEGGKIVLITRTGYRIIVDREIMPNLNEGEIINIEYTINIDATAELENRIETLQINLLDRSE